MKNKPEVKAYIDTDLITLAYSYLASKSRKTKKKYTVADLFETCELILQKAEKPNQYEGVRFRFIDNHVEVYSEDLEKIMSASMAHAII